MQNVILVTQIIVGILVSALILLQAKGIGLGRTLGPAAYHSKRGMEKIIFRLTIVLTVLFVSASVAALFV